MTGGHGEQPAVRGYLCKVEMFLLAGTQEDAAKSYNSRVSIGHFSPTLHLIVTIMYEHESDTVWIPHIRVWTSGRKAT